VRSSVKPSRTANDSFLGRTRKVWQPRLGRDLSYEDARQVAENVTGFFSVLTKWSHSELAVLKNDSGDALTYCSRAAGKTALSNHRGGPDRG
jgi:hypothetical protein